MKKILSLVLALMLLVMIPVEAVAATRVEGRDYAQQWYAPEGGTVMSFQAADTSQSYIYYIVYLSTDLTTQVLMCIQNKDVMDYIKEYAQDMTVSAIAKGVALILECPIAEDVVEFAIDFSLWALETAKVAMMVNACKKSPDGKIKAIKWCAPPWNFTFETFEPWEGDYVDDTYFGVYGCIPGTQRTFKRGVYVGYEEYK